MGVFININCIYADNPGGYCKNEKIKKNLFGLGARLCKAYPFKDNACEYQIKFEKPEIVVWGKKKFGFIRKDDNEKEN